MNCFGSISRTAFRKDLFDFRLLTKVYLLKKWFLNKVFVFTVNDLLKVVDCLKSSSLVAVCISARVYVDLAAAHMKLLL